MEKNGGSCAGKQRFHVFVTDSFSWNAKMSPKADSGAGVAGAEAVRGRCVQEAAAPLLSGG